MEAGFEDEADLDAVELILPEVEIAFTPVEVGFDEVESGFDLVDAGFLEDTTERTCRATIWAPI